MSEEERQRMERGHDAATSGADRSDGQRARGEAGGEQPGAHDDAWLERVRDVYGPEPMTPAERYAFDARLEERIEARARRGRFGVLGGLPLWQPVTAGAVAVAAVWLTLVPSPDPTPTLSPTPAEFAATRRAASLADWEREILAAADAGASTTPATTDEILPDDYRAIAGLFLAGGGGATAHGR